METRTRSGRVSKPPVKYEPTEEVIDDYSDEDEDDEDEDEDEDDEDADENGNLKDFIVDDESDSDEEEA